MRRYCTINGEFEKAEEARRDQKYGLEKQFVFVSGGAVANADTWRYRMKTAVGFQGATFWGPVRESHARGPIS